MFYPVRFQDADFEHRFAWCSSPLEGRSLRWVPFGMPRLNSTFKNMVFFLYGRDPQSGKVVGPMGTGFLVGLPGDRTWYLRHYYAVTCWHVAVQHGASIIRINTRDGKSRQIEIEPHDWQFIPGSDDLCAADVTERFQKEDNVSFVLDSLLITKEFVKQEELEVGEDGFMLGLFAEQPGIDHNMVASRFGNVSLLAAEDAPIEQPNGNKCPSHIFDMRSRPGFSGSPVFVYRTPAGDLRSATERGRDIASRRSQRRHNRYSFLGAGGDFGYQVIDHSSMHDWQDELETRSNTFLMLLGVHAGQYPEKIEARKVRRVEPENDDLIRDMDKLRIPSSMAVVVPSWRIADLLNLDFFQQQRRERDDRAMKQNDEKNIPVPESATDDDAPPTSDKNPDHRMDFDRLLTKAAKQNKDDV